MRHSAHISIPIAALQVLVVIVGVFVTRLSLTGFLDEALANPRYRVPVLIHHHGYLLLAVPLLWTGLILWLENRPATGWSRRWTVVSGLVFLAALFCFLFTYSVYGFDRNL
ncbi:MAG: hypothetical protein EOP88_21025 [Verrucomicrobiaceae bacterium]|nr:MAG: hypothetical protein EOP88_21025 [Verrucomicrobiaceae bacterium]